MPDSAVRNEIPAQQEYVYIVQVKEHLKVDWSEGFEGLIVTYTPEGETLLSGFMPDQSALHGLLARIRDLNLTLISLNRITSEAYIDIIIDEVRSKCNQKKKDA